MQGNGEKIIEEFIEIAIENFTGFFFPFLFLYFDFSLLRDCGENEVKAADESFDSIELELRNGKFYLCPMSEPTQSTD